MPEDYGLEPEQKQLLKQMVEIMRSVERPRRHKFIYSASMDGANLVGPGSNNIEGVWIGDLETLARSGLLFESSAGRDPNYDITQKGYSYYEQLMEEIGQPIQRVEVVTRDYFDTHNFQRRHPLAYQKWTQAEASLWSSDTEEQLSLIGHLCREAAQEFAASLAASHGIEVAPREKAKTVKHIRAVLESFKANVSEAVREFLDALLAYWGTTNDLIQRQEHGGQKEGEALTWEDARRVVFHTALIMYELDRVLGK